MIITLIFRLKTLIDGGENDAPEISYVMENNQINPWVTTTGAISATALAFLATNDHEIASWFQIPNSAKLIEQIKPNDITLRVIARLITKITTFHWPFKFCFSDF